MTWTSLISPPAPPAWNGPARRHVLDDTTPKTDPMYIKRGPPKGTPKPGTWKPWRLLGPAVRMPPAAACWPLISAKSEA